MESEERGPGFNTWYSPGLLAHYRLTPQLAVAARVEYYQDPDGVIISSNSPKGFKTSGYSLNLDYGPARHVLVRVEGRLLEARDAIFIRRSGPAHNSTTITSSMAISF
jgi:hypothetical protein